MEKIENELIKPKKWQQTDASTLAACGASKLGQEDQIRLMHLPVKNKLIHVGGTAKNKGKQKIRSIINQVRAVRQKIIAVFSCFITAIHSGHLNQSSSCYKRARFGKQKNYSGSFLMFE